MHLKNIRSVPKKRQQRSKRCACCHLRKDGFGLIRNYMKQLSQKSKLQFRRSLFVGVWPKPIQAGLYRERPEVRHARRVASGVSPVRAQV
nr:hypothetical protein [uncultured bacterium]